MLSSSLKEGQQTSIGYFVERTRLPNKNNYLVGVTNISLLVCVGANYVRTIKLQGTEVTSTVCCFNLYMCSAAHGDGGTAR